MANRGRGQYRYGNDQSAQYHNNPHQPQYLPTSSQTGHTPSSMNEPRRQYSACASQRPLDHPPSYAYPSNSSQQQYKTHAPNYQQYEGYTAASQARPEVSRQITPNSTYIDEATTSWLNRLRHMWTLYKKSPAVTQTLHGYFDTSPNAYKSALFVMTNCGDFHQAKANSLAFTVMEEFSRWLTPKRAGLRECLTQDVKLEAFKTVTNQRQPQLVKMVIEAYEMGTHKDIFLQAIRELIADKQYKEACQSITHLGLHQLFAVEDVLVPLVFQDKLNVAFDFLANSPQHQRQLVVYLDNLLGLRSIRNEVQSIICKLDIPDAKIEKLYGKPLSKLVARLVKTYNMSEDMCPNLNKKRRDGALQFIIGKRYQDRNLSLDSWREMALEAVRDDADMHAELVASVSQAGDPAEALYWARRLSVPRSSWPVLVHDEEAKSAPVSSALDTSVDSSENWDESSGPPVDYHPFALSHSDITIVDSIETFQYLHHAIRGVNIVGIDSEWKAHFGTGSTKLALIQVATSSHVYILDVFRLGQDPERYEDHWRQLAAQLFNNKDIRKLGFGLSSDLQMIRSAILGLANITQQGTNFLEVINLWKYLLAEGMQFPHEGCENGGEGLSRLVECSLGRPLNKAEQFSNWENRPLRDCQKIYAACDAHCLLEVYEALRHMCSGQMGRYIPFEAICDEVVSSLKVKKIKKPKPVTSDAQESVWRTPQRAGNVRALCDNMITGLGLHLRKCGIDCVNLQAGQGPEYIQDLVSREPRIIITRGKRYNELMSYVPPGHCYAVRSDVPEEQVAEVFQFFNIALQREDVFTRCSKCNSASLISVSNATMSQLAARCEYLAAQPSTASYRHHSNWQEDSDEEEEGHAAPTQAAVSRLTYRAPEPAVDVSRCLTSAGATIDIAGVPDDVLARQTVFYVCQHCGKCYWDGSHIDRFIESIKENL